MKKSILALAILSMAAACKKVPEGGNKGAIKIKEGVEHYSDDEHRTVLKPVADTTTAANTSVNINGTDSAKVNTPAAAAPTHGTENTVNTTSAPVNNAKTDVK